MMATKRSKCLIWCLPDNPMPPSPMPRENVVMPNPPTCEGLSRRHRRLSGTSLQRARLNQVIYLPVCRQ